MQSFFAALMFIVTLVGGLLANEQGYAKNLVSAQSAGKQMSADIKNNSAVTVNNISVDINHASVEEFTQIKGLGPSRAKAIVLYRQEHGNFTSVDELANVKGISMRFVNAHREQFTVDE
ncbi:MAG: hypothetical protein Tsb005_04870 [Gammaproteobacteria bacterium]